MYSKVKKTIRVFIKFIEIICIATMAALILFLFAQVVARYIIQMSIPWTEELVRYLFIWNVFVGAGVAAFRNEHVKVEFFVKKLPFAIKDKFILFTCFLLLIIFIIIFRQSLIFVLSLRGQTTMVLRISRVVPYSSVPAGFFIMILGVTYQIVDYFDERK